MAQLAYKGLFVQKKKKEEDISQIPQWKLMLRRFMQNRLSVIGGSVLILFYLMALFADFIAPNRFDELDSDYPWAPPTPLRLDSQGVYYYPLISTLDKEHFKFVFTKDLQNPLPVKLFVHGRPYKALGLIESDLHLFGVETPEGAEQEAKIFLWGADRQGRDLFARVLQGARVSLTIGLVSIAISTLLGVTLGTASGYFGGAIDNLMQRSIELIQTFPTVPLWAALSAILPRDLPVIQRYLLISAILSLIGWTGLARQVRGKVMSYRSADYTAAAQAAGASNARIIFTHLVPNTLSHVIVVSTLAIPGTIMGETALSFLGLGMMPPAVSWGVLMRDAQQVQMVLTFPWMLLPGLAVILTVLCFSFMGDGLRDAVDPYG